MSSDVGPDGGALIKVGLLEGEEEASFQGDHEGPVEL